MKRHPIFKKYMDDNEPMSAELTSDGWHISEQDVDIIIKRITEQNKSVSLTLAKVVKDMKHPFKEEPVAYICMYCGVKRPTQTHKPDCPVLLAEKIIKEAK